MKSQAPSNPTSAEALLEFGPFRVDPPSGVLTQNGRFISLPPKAFEVLVCLLKNGSRPITREALMDAVWGETCVEEANLTQAISVLRKALGDESRDSRYILTIPRRGYRFGAPVREVHTADDPSSHERNARPNSIIVLPFVNLSGDPDNEYFSDGLTEEITNTLAPVSGLKVVARTTAFQFKGQNLDVRVIGSRVGADAVLEGSVRRQGGRVRITAQMNNARDGCHYWSRAWDRELGDIFAVQQEIADGVVNAMGATGACVVSTTGDPEAYRLYLRGLYLSNKLLVREAADVLEQAVKRDPAFAGANAALGYQYSLLGYEFRLPPKEAYAIASRYTNVALDLSPSLPSALFSRGWISTFYDWDWIGAERYLKRAIAGSQAMGGAHHAYAHFLVAMDRFPEALVESQQMLAEEPSAANLHGHLAWHYIYSGQPDFAIPRAEHAVGMDPSIVPNLRYLRWAYEATGQFEEAIKTAERHCSPEFNSRLRDAFRRRREAGYWEAWVDHLLVERDRDYGSPYEIATILTRLNRGSEAMKWLQCAFDERDSWIVYLKVDPKLQGLHGEPKFIELVRTLRLP